MAKYYYFCHNFVFLQVLRKSSLYRLSRYAIVILCLIFLVYKILNIDNPHIVLQHFCKASRQRFLLLVVAVALLPVNVILESIKWQTVLRNIVSLPFAKALSSVLFGYTGAFITPNSVGEYPTRALLLPEGSRTQAIAMGFVGSIVQTMVIAACGAVSLFFFVQNTDYSGIEYTKIFISIVLLLLLAVVFVSKIHTVGVFMQKSRFGFVRKIGNGLYYTTASQLAKLITISLLKYFAFSTQFLLILIAFGLDIAVIEAIVAINVFYLFLTFTPLINIFEVAVRSSWAILIFGCYSVSSISIIAASTLFWIMNFCLPTFVGLFFSGKKVDGENINVSDRKKLRF